MRAITLTEFGGPEVMTMTEVDTPTPAADELLITVVAIGVNRADLLQRQGYYPPPPGISDLLGLEVSGHVAEVGADVTGWQVGDPVVALIAGGGYAEYVAVPAGQCAPPPAGVDLISAAGVIEVAATVASNFNRVGLKAGETVLIHGGAGGIGTFAVQYAKALGCRVITTVGTQVKLDFVTKIGADVAIDYHEDWPAAVAGATDGRGVDVILDVMGAKYLESNVASLAHGGRLVVIGLQGGRKGTLDINALLAKSGTITATSLRFRPVEQKVEIVSDVVERVWPMIESGAVKLSPETRFQWNHAVRAHQHLASGESVGKVILIV